MSDSLANNVREGTVEILELLADFDAQSAYERNVPIANVPVEFVCMWFDDMYHPEAVVHCEAFSASERRALAKFHDFYDRHVDLLPQNHGVAALHATPVWREIVDHAGAALRAFDAAS